LGDEDTYGAMYCFVETSNLRICSLMIKKNVSIHSLTPHSTSLLFSNL
jgi:hypothetical protein